MISRACNARIALRAAVTSLLLLSGASLTFVPEPVRGETAAQAARKPVQPPMPYRLADGHPNWTGFWAPSPGMLEFNIGLGGVPAGAPLAAMVRPFSHFSALKSPYKEQLATAMREADAGKVMDPVAQCFPPGMPRMMGMVYGMELLQTPGQIAVTSEWQASSRRIWLNQSSHTPAEELDPTYAGESIGHWEGDTLVVDTIGIRGDVPLNYDSLPHSDKLHVVERFTETTPGKLTDEITIEDPDAFVAPWKEIETYRYRPDLRIREFVCLENNRNVGEHGEAVFDKK